MILKIMGVKTEGIHEYIAIALIAIIYRFRISSLAIPFSHYYELQYLAQFELIFGNVIILFRSYILGHSLFFWKTSVNMCCYFRIEGF